MQRKKLALVAGLIVVLMASVAYGAVVNYLSNIVTKPVEVKSPIELTGTMEYWSADQYLRVVEGGTAEWSTEQAYSGSYSVHITDVSETSSGSVAALIPAGSRIQLKDITEIGFMEYSPSSSSALYGAGFILRLVPEQDTAWDTTSGPGTTWDALHCDDEWFGDKDAWQARDMFAPTREVWLHSLMGGPAEPATTLEAWQTEDFTGKNLGEWYVAGFLVLAGEGTYYIGYDGYVDDVKINVDIYDLEPVIEEFDGATFIPQLYGGSEFFMDFKAKNLANTPIEAPFALVMDCPNGWEGVYPIPEIAEIDPLEFAYGYSTGNAYLVLVFDELGTIAPSATKELSIRMQLAPNALKGPYTIKALVVWEGTIPEAGGELTPDQVTAIVGAAEF